MPFAAAKHALARIATGLSYKTFMGPVELPTAPTWLRGWIG